MLKIMLVDIKQVLCSVNNLKTIIEKNLLWFLIYKNKK
jgi:hypothetical protein